MSIKEYVNNNIKVSELNALEKAKLSRFNRCIDFIDKKYKKDPVYEYYLKQYINSDKIDLVIIFVNLISYDDRLLKQDKVFINEFIAYLYKENIPFYLYEKYTKIVLLKTFLQWFDLFNNLKLKAYYSYIDAYILFSLLFINLDTDKRTDLLEMDIDILFSTIYDVFDPLKEEKWFCGDESIDVIHDILYAKTVYIYKVLNSMGASVFTDEFAVLNQMKKINFMSDDSIDTFRKYVFKIDGMQISDIDKIRNILSIVKDYIKTNNNDNKIVSLEEVRKKYENR